MAGLLDFLGGAAGAYAGIANENRQRSQMEEYNNRLRQQELEDWKKKEQYRQQLAREGRAGELLGSPQITPTGQMVGLRYNEQGTDPTPVVLGEIPGQREEYERRLLQEQENAALTRAEKESRIDRNRASAERARRAPQGGSREPSAKDRIALEDRAVNLALEEAGISRSQGKYFRYEPDPDSDTGELRQVPVPPNEVARIRRQVTQGAASGSGTSRDNPLVVSPSDPEPPDGTWIQLPDGRVVQHRR